MKRIRVTHLETGNVETYDYSDNNWRRTYACMRNGAVIMWVPLATNTFGPIVTSGRRWEVLS